MTTSRMMFAPVLAAGLVFAGGCGSDSEPAVPNVKLDETPPTPAAPAPQAPAAPPSDPNAPSPKAEAPKGMWELDQTKHAIPAAPVSGSIAGVEETPLVQLEGAELTFHTE